VHDRRLLQVIEDFCVLRVLALTPLSGLHQLPHHFIRRLMIVFQ